MPERLHEACGSWPKLRVTHIPAIPSTIERLADLTRSCASQELAIHFHVYRDQVIFFECHDAFGQAMLLSGDFSEESVRTFAERLNMSYERVGPGAPPNGDPAATGDNPNAAGVPPAPLIVLQNHLDMTHLYVILSACEP